MSADLSSAFVELLAATDPREVRSGLVRLALRQTGADRCTLTTVHGGVLRVEDSFEPGGSPEFIGQAYPLSYMETQPLIGRAISRGHWVTGGNFGSQGQVAPELKDSLDRMRRTAIVPLKLGVEVGALFVLSRKQDVPFEAADLDRLQELGGLVVLSLHDARVHTHVTPAQRRGLNALTLFSEYLASSEELTAFFGRMSRSVATLAGARRVAYWMLDGEELVAQPETYGFTEQELAGMRTPLSSALKAGLERVVYGGAALHWNHSSDVTRALLPIAPGGVENLLAVPWRTSERPLGILVAYDSRSGFVEQDELITRLAARASALVWQGYTAQRQASLLQASELDRLKHHAARMAAVERQKSDFLKLASHELRGPITIVRGYLSMLTDGTIGELSPAVRAAVDKMAAHVLIMKGLVDEMLTAARLEDTRLPVSPYETRIDEVVRDVVAAHADLNGTPHRIIVDAPTPAPAFADRRHVETIVTNLLSNAVKYSPEGGDVTLSVRENGEMVELEVADQGIGMEPSSVLKLFQPFSRLDDAESLSVEGVGLGLYLARELARVQHGDIAVRSEPGRGSVFTLRLPRRRQTEG
jgi:signal transduction histidine kinase